MTQRVALQPGYVLHHRPYRDTSLLLEVFSREFGRVGLVARGARSGRSRLAALLQPFRPLLLSWSAKGELGTLTAAEADGVVAAPEGAALISGFYLNELLIRLVGRNDPMERLYGQYTLALHRLALGEGEAALRLFEAELLQEVGYGLILDHDGVGEPIVAERRYCYSLESGPVAVEAVSDDLPGPRLHGATLTGLANGELDTRGLTEAKRLMRVALAPHLGDRPLKSRELFLSMYGNGKARTSNAKAQRR
ncbi:DNA repair protein RecO [Endothiovibrio diazotrophicus]